MIDDYAARRLAETMLGEELGSGVGRSVYALRHSLDGHECVVKVETAAQSFQNISEWLVWQDFRDTPQIAKWLAPCVSISPDGTVLIQRRCEPIPEARLPKKLPSFLTDLKKSNWGLLKNRPVCLDYGHVVYELSERSRTARWST